MAPRKYQQSNRAEAAEKTRQRIVQATFALHDEQGIEATTMKQIAARADVSIGTVYHHFPTYEDCIRACGEYTAQLVPMPDESCLQGLGDLQQRLQALVQAWFGYYAQSLYLEEVRVLRRKYPVIEEFMQEMERQLGSLVAQALHTTRENPQVAMVAAMLDVAVYSALLRQGMQTQQAVRQVADLLHVWLTARHFP